MGDGVGDSASEKDQQLQTGGRTAPPPGVGRRLYSLQLKQTAAAEAAEGI